MDFLSKTKTGRRWRWPAATGAGAACLLGLTGCQPSTYEVTYKVTGTTTKASITMQNAQGQTEQSEIMVPWSQTFTVHRGQFLYLSASNQEGYGSITCDIALTGHGSKTATSDGQFAIASCSARANVRR